MPGRDLAHERCEASIHESSHHAVRSFEDLAEQFANFVEGQRDGKSLRSFRAFGVKHHIHFENLGIEEENGGESLVVGIGGDLALDREVSQKLVDFRIGQIRRVNPFPSFVVVEPEEFTDPADIGLFGSDRHMSGPHGIANLVEQSSGGFRSVHPRSALRSAAEELDTRRPSRCKEITMVLNYRRMLAAAVCLVGMSCPGDVAAQDPTGGAKALEGLWSGSWGGGERDGVVFQPVNAELVIQGDHVELYGFHNVSRLSGTVRFDAAAKKLD
jgi:hypothetical protein